MTRLTSRTYLPALVAGVAYAVLALSWAVGNPPFAAPDEPAHYLRALAVGDVSLAGNMDVEVPAGLWFTRDPGCNKFHPEQSAACVDALVPTDRSLTVESAAGLYPPAAYLLSGAAARLESNAQDADRAGRLVLVGISSVLFVLAAVLLWSHEAGYVSLVGLAVAVTPMVIFVSSMLTNSALETSAGLMFAAAIIRLARPGRHSAWVWAAAAVSGGLMTVARTTGILWMCFGVALYCILVGLSGLRESVRISRTPVIGAAVVLVAAAAANRAWEATYGTDVAREGPLAYPWTDKIGEAFSRLDRLGREWIGTFGWLDTTLPKPVFLAWLVLGAALVALALVVGRPRQRLALLVALGLAVASAVLLSATLRAGELGGNVQARHLMPFLVVIPLLAGELVTQRRLPRWSIHVTLAIVSFTAAIHVIAWYWNARRQAVGTDGSILFLSHSAWAPPLGWAFWLVVTIAAAALLPTSAVIGRLQRR
ncbi:MAG TPA: DUF2142 domain-containing protein [Gaiellaceae bacterium]|jgi:hypothetical protein|nr:DUF2142 domain-containing protein [Gaiellaceae bacterium]